jgi:hypothetical protein
MVNIMFLTILALEWTRGLCRFLMGFGLCSLLLTNRAKRTIDVRMNIIFLEDFFGGNNANVRHFLSRLEKLIEFVNKYGVFWTTQKKHNFWDSFLFLYTTILFLLP